MICFTLPILQVCNFANNLTFHACDNDFNTLIMRLENDVSLTINWFENSSTKINKSKCHILASGHKYGNFGVKMENAKQKSLGVELEEISILMITCLHYIRKQGENYRSSHPEVF